MKSIKFQNSIFSLLGPKLGIGSIGGFVLVYGAWLPGFVYLSRKVWEGIDLEIPGVSVIRRARLEFACVL